jgi:phytoene synthase
MYADIGHEVRRRGGDSVSQRAVVSKRRKVWLLICSLAAAVRGRSVADLPVLESVRFLVEAAARAPLPSGAREAVARKSVDERIGWMVELFSRLDERQQMES